MFEVKKNFSIPMEALLEVTFEEATVNEAKRQAAAKISREVNILVPQGQGALCQVLQYVGEN